MTNTNTNNNTIVQCSQVNVTDIKAKKIDPLNNTMLYPYHDINGKSEPILFQTNYITLQNNLICKKFGTNKDDFKTIRIRRKLGANDDPIDELFALCHKIDNYMLTNKHIILNDIINNNPNNLDKYSYNKIVSTNLNSGNEHLKLKLNITKYDKATEMNSINDLCVRIFYKGKTKFGNFTGDRMKDHKLTSLNKILKSGTKIRFILSVNKIWYNSGNYGVCIKALQIEIDDTITNTFQILDKIKDNNKNMFKNDEDDVKKNNDYKFLETDHIKKMSQFGISKNKTELNNNKIVNLLKTGVSSMFKYDDTEYSEPVNEIVVNI